MPYYNDPEKARNREIFKDSKEQMENVPALRRAIENTIGSQKVYLESDPIDCPVTTDLPKPEIFTSNRTTIQAALLYKDVKPCILNFASFTKPGGGVAFGCRAQEESMCRITTLFPCISTKEMDKAFYAPHRALNDPKQNDDLIFSPDVLIFKDDGPRHNMLNEEDFFKVDVISLAAPNFSKKPSNRYNPSNGDVPLVLSDDRLLTLLEKRFDRLLQVAHKEKVEVLILGAIGCGAFHNPPDVVAEAFQRSIAKYGNGFKTIEFAIPGPMEGENYAQFKTVFSGKGTIAAKPAEPKKPAVSFPDLVGAKVSHVKFGEGVIVSGSGSKVNIAFDGEQKAMDLSVAFPKFLTFAEPEVQEKIQQLLQVF